MKINVQAVTDFIFYSTPIDKADIIFVPGGHPRELMERAAKIYHAGYAKTILPSGGKNPYIPGNLSEWEFLKKVGIELGIPETAFFREDKASNTYENAQFSFNVLLAKGISVKRAIIVCKAFHARRSLLTYKKVFNSNTEFMVSPIHDERNIRFDNWFADPEKVKKV